MQFLPAARSSSARSLPSATVNSTGASYAVRSNPTRLRYFSQHPIPSRPSVVNLSIVNNAGFNHRKSSILTQRSQHFVPSAAAEISSPGELPIAQPDRRRLAVAVWSAITLILAVGNRVLQKLALVPMKDHPFFLSQLNSIVYVVVYFSALHFRHRAGITTDEMLAIPKSRFVVIGLLEAISIVSGMYAGAVLPGPAIPLLFQTFVVWQLVFSRVILGRKYSPNQILGCFLVAAGVIVAVTSGSANSKMLSGVGLLWPSLMVASSAFQACASIVKESVFLDAKKRLKGKSLDVFVVNSFGSGFGALFILMFLPILKGILASDMSSYFTSGVACFLNIGTNGITACDGAPLLPLLYILSNILFNISILNLLKVSDAVVASLASRSAVPIAMYILSLPLPYLPKGVTLSPFFHLGTVILVAGLVLYNVRPWSRKQDD